MHGLINRALQSFLTLNYGPAAWSDIARDTGLSPDGFEAMLHYPDSVTETLLAAASRRLDKSQDTLLEDLGAHLASLEPVRRLLRFGGGDYWEFLMSLEELQGRGQMALPDLRLPELALNIEENGLIRLRVRGDYLGWGLVMTGLVRAMADDYGSLALIEPLDPQAADTPAGAEDILVTLLDTAFAEGRTFDLAGPMEDA
ncbi:hypothetical protein BFP70_10980 [Thioclava sp. SK-1]|uniref:heme NO-binding domain-containing protein n=1 Tax=Thioclava sp. SK-1 TaxID=1889770 RepID=UPI00082630BE|nr:heme NO-binding domain-containing protein [Thioclava sp. SK-1]OCX64551.1 hypothetical protein BFP70_10980 [Thioclava sp. SK-1]